VHHTVFNGDNLSRSTVSRIELAAINISLFIYEGPYLTSNLFWNEFRVALMADFVSPRYFVSNEMWRTRLWTRTHDTDTATNSFSSFGLNSTPFIFILKHSLFGNQNCTYHSNRANILVQIIVNHTQWNTSTSFYSQHTGMCHIASPNIHSTTALLRITDYTQRTGLPIHLFTEFPSLRRLCINDTRKDSR